MNGKEFFTNIIDADETILEIFKPNKKRAVFLNMLGWIIPCSIFLVIIVLTAIFGSFESDLGEIGLWIALGFLLLVMLIPCLVSIFNYKKSWYCCTNKRIIVRSGVIGADYQSLDYRLIGGINVRVDFLDKLVKPNTGTIIFASCSVPLVGAAVPASTGYGFAFVHVSDPYAIYKRVSEYINLHKN